MDPRITLGPGNPPNCGVHTEHRKENHDLTESFEKEFFDKAMLIEDLTKGYMKIEAEVQSYKEW